MQNEVDTGVDPKRPIVSGRAPEPTHLIPWRSIQRFSKSRATSPGEISTRCSYTDSERGVFAGEFNHWSTHDDHADAAWRRRQMECSRFTAAWKTQLQIQGGWRASRSS